MTDRLYTLIRAELARPLRPWPKFTDAATLAELGADALDLITLSMAIEDAFGIRLHDADVTGATSISELCALVGRLVNQEAA